MVYPTSLPYCQHMVAATRVSWIMDTERNGAYCTWITAVSAANVVADWALVVVLERRVPLMSVLHALVVRPRRTAARLKARRTGITGGGIIVWPYLLRVDLLLPCAGGVPTWRGKTSAIEFCW